MMTIRQLARRFGLSRATLLYYDRIGLLRPSTRSGSGYRLYDSDAERRLADIVLYRGAGLPLAAIGQLLDGPQSDETGILSARMRALGIEIETLRSQQRAIAEMIARSDGHATALFDKQAWIGILAAAGMDESQMNDWHRAFEASAPDAHHAFLRWIGLSEEDIAAARKSARERG